MKERRFMLKLQDAEIKCYELVGDMRFDTTEKFKYILCTNNEGYDRVIGKIYEDGVGELVYTDKDELWYYTGYTFNDVKYLVNKLCKKNIELYMWGFEDDNEC